MRRNDTLTARIGSLGCALLAALLAGCSSGPAPAEVCDRLLACSPGSDRGQCDEAMGQMKSVMRSSAWADFGDCLVDLPCDELLADGFDFCLAQAADEAPEDAADSLVGAWCEKAVECGEAGGISVETCKSMAKGAAGRRVLGMVTIIDGGILDCVASCIRKQSCSEESDYFGTCGAECNMVQLGAGDSCEHGDYSFGFCQCEEGWTGPQCDACAAGMRDTGDRCVPSCSADSCSGRGTCDEFYEGIRCACEEGYSGERCESCAPGYGEQGGECVKLCEEDTCSGHGSCDGSSGAVVCSCDLAYSGDRCQSCAAGYAQQGGACTAPVTQIDVGGGHFCALLKTGDLRCWGNNGGGQLGLGDRYARGTVAPGDARTIRVGGKVAQIALGSSHTCALLDTGRVRCWGRGDKGQLGYGNTQTIGDDEHPEALPTVKIGGTVTQVAAGADFTCALIDDGTVRCWGNNDRGQLGLGHTDTVGDDEVPTAMPPLKLGGKALQLAVGGNHACALLAGDLVRCWGDQRYVGFTTSGGASRNVGDDDVPADYPPLELGPGVTQISAGLAHTCTRYATGELRCWGDGGSGRLGYGNTSDVTRVTDAGLVDVGGKVAMVSAGYEHTCAVLESGAVRCWGRNDPPALGYGNLESIGDTETPQSAGDVSLGGKALQVVAAPTWVSCALLEAGTVRCWGQNANGQLGYPREDDIGDDETPADAGDVPLF